MSGSMSGMGDMFTGMMGGAMTPNGMMGNPMAAMAAMAAMSGGGMMGGLEGISEEGGDSAEMNAQMMNMAMASMLSASAGGDMGMGAMGMGMGMPMGMGMGDEFDTAKLDADGGGSYSGAPGGSFSSVASQPAQMMQMMQMAQMAQMAAMASGADPTDPSNPATAQVNMIQQMMSNMAMGGGMGGGGMMDAGGSMDGDAASSKRDSVVTNSFTPNQSFQQQQFQKQMKTMMTNMQIARTVATSDTLKGLTDEQVQEISDKKFETAKDFLNFMKSANTEVGSRSLSL